MPSVSKEADNESFRNSENLLNGEVSHNNLHSSSGADFSSVEAMDQSDSYNVNYDLNEIKTLLKKSLQPDQIWGIISKEWLDKCLAFLESPDDQSKHPGPIDNSPILLENTLRNGQKQIRLKPDLREENDYITVPEELCDFFAKKFGAVEGFGQTIYKRQVLNKGKGYLIVEIYPLELRLTRYNSKSDYVMEFSGNTTLMEIINDMKTKFEVAPSRPVQLFLNSTILVNATELETALQNQNGNGCLPAASNSIIPMPPPPPQSSALKKLHECGFGPGTILTLEVQNVDGTWPSSRASKIGAMTRSKAQSGTPTVTPGLCGLSNLGNTCFMNSALQCLSNTTSLTDFLLSDKYLDDINEDNPLGNGGEIARVYGDLIKAIWSGYHSTIAPREFKVALGRFAPQFSGFSQHDCQELMSFLLDGLHEDLNRVKKKPYFELKDGLGRPDEEVASERWVNYKRRNDSIIVDIFHSQLKSTLVCPECDLVSITFDPFCYLTLPLPYKHTRIVESIVFIPAISKRPEIVKSSYAAGTDQTTLVRSIQFERISIPKSGNVSEICNIVAKMMNDATDKKGQPLLNRKVDPDRCKVANIQQNRLVRFLTPETTYSQTFDDIFIYEEEDPVMDPATNRQLPSYTIPVFIREVNKGTIPRARPFLITVKEMSFELIQEAIIAELTSIVVKSPDNFVGFIKNLQTQSSTILRDGSDGEGSDKEEETQDGLTEEGCIENSDEPQSPYNTRSRNVTNMFSISVVNRHAEGNRTENTIIRADSRLEFSETLCLAVNMNSDVFHKFFPNEINRHLMIRFSDMVSFNYDVQKKSSLTLAECINQFTQIEKLGSDDPWYCPRCKQHQRASKKFDIWSLPNVLIIHLKRFSYSRYQRDKLDVMVEYPVEQLDMTPYVLHNPNNETFTYDLIAVANHFGGLGGGHYTAYGKNVHTKKWHCFDDSSVSTTDGQVVTKNAYVLFYQRRETLSESTQTQENNGLSSTPPASTSNAESDVVMNDVSSSTAT